MISSRCQMCNLTALNEAQDFEKDVGPENEAKLSVEYFEKKFEKNKLDMNLCLKLIDLNKNNREQLAFYREHVATFCPTNEEFWRTWIEEEQKEILKPEIAANANDLTAAERNVISLYRRGLNIMPTVDLWVDYLKFLHHLCVTHTSRFPPASGVSRIRRACEFALRDLGFHSIEGPRLWEFYRKFELMLLNSIFDNQSPQDSNDAKLPLLHQQIERVRSLFKRQLVLPLAGKKDLLDEYRIFEAELPDHLKASREESAVIEELYYIGSNEWESRRELEREVIFLDDARVEDINRLSESWNSFIEFEKACLAKDRFSRVSAVYYRACEDLGHIRSDLWQAWAKWILSETKDSRKAAAILNRAVRFHPGNARLWSMLVSCHNCHTLKHLEKLKQIFTRATLGLNSTADSQNPYDITVFCIVLINSSLNSTDYENNSYCLKPETIVQKQSDLNFRNAAAFIDENLMHAQILHTDFYQMKTHPDPIVTSFIREVFGFGEKLLLSRVADMNGKEENLTLENRQTIDNVTSINTHMCDYENTTLANTKDTSLVTSLHRLLCYWINVEAKMFNNFSNALRITQVLLKFLRDSQASYMNNHWSYVINLLSAISSKPHQVNLLRNIIEEIKSSYKNDNTENVAFLRSWLEFEKRHGDSQKVLIVEKLLASVESVETKPIKNENSEKNHTSQLSSSLSLTGLPYNEPHGLSAFEYESSYNFFSPSNKLARATLEQLRSRRQKRRRRLSGSESDTTYSDASSDSGSVTSFRRLEVNSAILNSNQKRYKCDEMKTYNSSSNYSLSQQIFKSPLWQEEREAFFAQKPPTSNTIEDTSKKSNLLSPSEVQEIENLTRSTWDGHECTDPATAPAIAPITSCMSPVLRRSRSSSESSTSSTILQMPSCDLVYPFSQNNAVYFDVGSHTASYPEESKRKKRKLLQPEEHNKNEANCQREVKKEEIQSKIIPRKGAHYLQQQVSNRLGDTEILGTQKEKCTVYVSNLDASVREADLKNLFEDCPGLKSIRLIRDYRRRLKGFCYIDFETPELAAEAVAKKENSKLHKRRLTIAISESKADIYEKTTLFLSNLPLNILNLCDDFKSLIASVIESAAERSIKCTIKVRDVRLIIDPITNTPKGYGYVDFFTLEDTQKALQILCEELKLPNTENTFMLSPSVPMKAHRYTLASSSKLPKQTTKKTELQNSKFLFVKNLSFSTTEESLKKHFDSDKTVNCVYICCDNNGKSKGFGFVEFKTEHDAFVGLMLNDTVLDGREITVCASHRVPKEPKARDKANSFKSKMVDKDMLSEKPKKRLDICNKMTAKPLATPTIKRDKK